MRPRRVVLGDVLPVLGELQRGADAVGERDPVGRRRAEDVQDELADRVRREVAVVDELVERLVRGLPLVAPVRLDQPLERPARQVAARAPSAASRRSSGMLAARRRRRGRGRPRSASSVRQPVARDVVADLVDEPREAVDRQSGGRASRGRGRARRPRSSRRRARSRISFAPGISPPRPRCPRRTELAGRGVGHLRILAITSEGAASMVRDWASTQAAG